MTECYWESEKWSELKGEQRAAIKARQGVAFPMMEHITVMDQSMSDVPKDGKAQGEIMIRGNSVMKGYFKNKEATKEAFEGGYFHSGDIAVHHPDPLGKHLLITYFRSKRSKIKVYHDCTG